MNIAKFVNWLDCADKIYVDNHPMRLVDVGTENGDSDHPIVCLTNDHGNPDITIWITEGVINHASGKEGQNLWLEAKAGYFMNIEAFQIVSNPDHVVTE